MRKHGRTDTNQTEIIRALEAAGCSVLRLSDVGDGCPDLLVSHERNYPWHYNILVEVKRPGGKLTEAEREFFEAWRGPCIIVYGVEDALKKLGLT